ncbi:MAG: hypothetical protein PF483_11735 [Halothiobacillus sp.]|jgi:hypothetical protein|nr:hypothetical protein [Halothiobacillus sp.]
MTEDPDFPAPTPAQATTPTPYSETPEFCAMRGSMVAKAALDRLGALAAIDAPATGWACYDWLHINGAGMPYVSVLDTTAREDARFWAETAQPHELECYALASVDKLRALSGGHALFASKQIRRLSGALFSRMSPEEKKAFAAWIEKQMGGQE